MAIEVHTAAEEADAFGAKAAALDERAHAEAGGDPTSGGHHPVPGDGVLATQRQGPKRPAHGSGPSGDAEEGRDLSVGGDTASRDLSDEVVDPIEEALVAPHWGGSAVIPEAARAPDGPEGWC